MMKRTTLSTACLALLAVSLSAEARVGRSKKAIERDIRVFEHQKTKTVAPAASAAKTNLS